MITFNGTPLSVCTQEMADRIGGLVSWKDALQSSPQQWASWGYNDNPLLPGVFGDRPVEPGTLWWPTAAQEWAVGWFIVEATDAQNLEGSVGQVGTLELTWEEQETSGDDLVYDSNHFPVTTVVDKIQAQMTLLSMRKLAIGVNPTESGGPTYLCTFVDQRFFWWAANTGALAADGATTTWLNLYTSLAGKLGITLNNDPVSSNYSIPASIVSLQYEPVPQWLDTIAQNVGQRVLCQLDGTVWAHSPLTVNTQLPLVNPTADTVAGGTYYGSNLDLLPSSMDVVFPVFSTGVYQGTSYVINVPLGGTGGKATFKPGLVALGGVPSNLMDLTNYANQLAADLYLWAGQQLDVVLPGIQNVPISALHGNVLWTYQRDQLTTRVQYSPYEWREWPLSVGSQTVNNVTNITYGFEDTEAECNCCSVVPSIIQYPSLTYWNQVVQIPNTVTLSSNVNNMSLPPSVMTILNGLAAYTISGINATGVPIGYLLELFNLSSFVQTLLNLNSGSSVGNQFNTTSMLNLPILPMQSVTLKYQGPSSSQQWQQVSKYTATQLAKTTSTITAASGTTPGSGPATIYNTVGGVLTSTSQSITAYNMSGSSIPTGTYVTLVTDPGSGLLYATPTGGGGLDSAARVSILNNQTITGGTNTQIQWNTSPDYDNGSPAYLKSFSGPLTGFSISSGNTGKFLLWANLAGTVTIPSGTGPATQVQVQFVNSYTDDTSTYWLNIPAQQLGSSSTHNFNLSLSREIIGSNGDFWYVYLSTSSGVGSSYSFTIFGGSSPGAPTNTGPGSSLFGIRKVSTSIS